MTDYESLSAEIEQGETIVRSAAPGTAIFEQVCADVRALRARLNETPEQRALMAQWRARVEASAKRKQRKPVQEPTRPGRFPPAFFIFASAEPPRSA